jgi:CHAT domain-containing protein
LAEQKTVRHIFLWHVAVARDLSEAEPSRRAALTSEAFEVGQLAQATSAAAAVSRMAARFAAGDDDLARLVRARQDAIDGWRRLDQALIKAVSQPPDRRDAQAEARLRTDLAALDRRLTGLDAELAQAFPDYAELATPQPVALADIQKLLGPDEALMVYLVWDESTFLWVVRPDRAELHRIAVGADDLADAVAGLRAGLDPTAISRLGEIPPFDTTKAYELYSRIFAPAEALLEGVRHLMVVPDGALQSLPVGVLVTEAPQEPVTDIAGYRRVAWLARRYAVTVLPSVGSLRALRQFAGAARAKYPFVGFGDPLVGEGPAGGRGVDVADVFSRGAVADVDLLRQLARLEETADELYAIADTLGADTTSVILQEHATEARVRSMDLSDFRILAFATHGLVAGSLKGVAEPGLVLTPPERGTEADDGLLTASEIATLKLNADWVILSACNTAAADGTPGAEGLSGLAKAFFYAGSRALLVSHWPVDSDAAVALTTGMFAAAADDPAIGRAEALRRSMVALMEDPENPHYAHPMFWAPFIVVGEGGVLKSL